MLPHFRPWLDAWVESAYGERGFWRTSRPVDHFRTASATGTLVADTIAEQLTGFPEVSQVVELGAGDGQLLTRLAARRPDLALTGIDLRSRPQDLPDAVGWCRDCWDVTESAWTGPADEVLSTLDRPTLIVCAEWLDDLPCAVVDRSDGTLAPVEVDSAGQERVGPVAVPPSDVAWAARWWPHGRRVELGTTRDRAWTDAIQRLRSRGGLVLCIDYGHTLDTRPEYGSLSAYRRGEQVAPRPAPDTNLTAAVAVDALADAGSRAGARTVLRRRQADVIPARQASDLDPLADLVSRSQRSALVDRAVWGQQWWLLQDVPAGPHGVMH